MTESSDSPPTDADPDGASPAGEQDRAATGPQALGELTRHLDELAAYVRHFLSAKADATRLQVRRAVMMAALGAAALLVAAGGAIAAVVLALHGIAGGLGEWTGRAWLGELIVGLAVLALAGGGIGLGLRRVHRSSLEAAREKYERLKRDQRREFGRDIDAAGHDS